MTLVYGTLHIVTGTPLPVGAALVALPTYIALYFPATFLLEEVTFRGALDAHVHHDGETRGWQSAVFTSTLWGLWHLPVSHALPLPLQVTPWGYAWQIVLAVVFGLAAMVVCHTGFGWIRRGADGYDLRRINGVLRHVAGAGIVAAAVVGVAALAVDRPAVVDRLLHLVAFVSVASAASAAMVLLVVIGEQRREAREAAMADIYRRPGEADDDSADR
jgi:hypothetical protein